MDYSFVNVKLVEKKFKVCYAVTASDLHRSGFEMQKQECKYENKTITPYITR